MFEVFYLFNAQSLKTPIGSIRDMTGNKYVFWAILVVLVAQVIFTYTAPMQHLFGNTAIPASAWVRIVLISMTVFVLVEFEKRIIQRWDSKKKKIPERPTVQFMR